MAAASVKKKLILGTLEEQPTKHESIEVVSSEDRFLAYRGLLTLDGITKDNYAEGPNGKGEFAGMWVFPFRRDVWDMHVNRDYSIVDRVDILSPLDSRYISNPPSLAHFTNADGTYARRYARLWDFLYNQEHFIDVTLSKPRAKPFPSGPVSDPIMPDALPDTCAPPELSDRYPWAAWTTVVHASVDQENALADSTLHRSQRFEYLRAHGGKGGEERDSLNAFDLHAHDATNELSVLRRSFKSSNERSSPLPYNPVVIRGVSEYTTNGWLSFYRQAVRTTANLQFAADAETWRLFILAKNRWEGDGSGDPLQAVIDALRGEFHGYSMFERGDASLVDASAGKSEAVSMIPRVNPKTGLSLQASSEERRTLATMNLVLGILRDNIGRGDVVELVFSAADGSATFYGTPYKVVTLQVVRPAGSPQRVVAREGVVFNGLRPWTLSVPPNLSTQVVGELNVYEQTTTTWYTRDAGVRIDRVPGTVHQATVQFLDFGAKKVYAQTLSRNQLFEFTLEAVRLTVERVEFPLARSNDSFRLSRGLWNGVRFNNAELLERSEFAEELEHVIVTRWEEVKARSPRFFVRREDVRDVRFVPYFDRHRQFLWVQNNYETHHFYLFVFEAARTRAFVSLFGEVALLDVAALASGCRGVRWHGPDGRRVAGCFSSRFYVTVVLPRQLGRYAAFVEFSDGAVFFVPFDLKIRWPFRVSRDRLDGWDDERYVRSAGVWNPLSEAPSDSSGLSRRDSLRLAEHLQTKAFMAAVRSFAEWYHVDVQNYALLYPRLREYCEACQELLSDRVILADERMPKDVVRLLPTHLNPPLLLLALTVDDVDSSKAAAAYVVYDPVFRRWRNILVFDDDAAFDLPGEWLDRRTLFTEETKDRLFENYVLSSPEYVQGIYVDSKVREEAKEEEEEERENKSNLASRYLSARRRYAELRSLVESRPTLVDDYRSAFFNDYAETHSRFTRVVAVESLWRRAVIFEEQVLEVLHYLLYIRQQCFYYQIQDHKDVYPQIITIREWEKKLSSSEFTDIQLLQVALYGTDPSNAKLMMEKLSAKQVDGRFFHFNFKYTPSAVLEFVSGVWEEDVPVVASSSAS